MKFRLDKFTRFAAAVLLLSAAASAAHAADKQLDYKKVRDALPIMRDISDRGTEANLAVQQKMDRLLKTDSEEEALAVRKELAVVLEQMLDNKREMVKVTKDLLELPRSPLSDQQIYDRLAETTFQDVHWADANFDKCMRDISREVGVPIRLHYRVVQKNKITFDFQRTRAEAVLSYLCTGFDLRYVVYDGEIIVYKKITPTEERFIEYQKRHPDVELRYWDREKASGEYDVKKKTVSDEEEAKNAQRWSLESLDLGLLRENLLKIHIVEASSERHNQRLIAKTSFEAMTADTESTGDAEMDARNAEARRKMDFQLRTFILLELDGSIETIDTLQRVLGKNLVSDPSMAETKQFLERDAPAISWRNKELVSALKEFGAQLGVGTEVTGIPKNTELFIDLFVEGATVEQAIGFIVSHHEMKWKYEKGTLKFEYLDMPEGK